MKKILLSAFATSALLLAGCADEGAEVASTEAGRIREQDLYEEMKNEPLQGGMTVGETVLQKMLLQDVFDHLYGDQVTEETVDAELEESAEMVGGTVEEYEELLEMQGMDIQFVKDNIRLTQLFRAAIADRVEITEEEIEQAYEDGRPMTAQHILVEDEETANEVITQLEEGADFGELVTEYSQDPGSLETEGTYTFGTGEMVPEFEQAVQELEVDETTSEPVESEHGYHVIRRLAPEEEYASLEDQRDAIERGLLEDYMNDQQFMAKMVTELAEEANVQISDEDLAGAMAAYMPQDEVPIESETEDAEGVEETDESAEDAGAEEETTEEAPKAEEEQEQESVEDADQ